MGTLNRHQALALNTIIRKSADVRYFLSQVECDIKSLRQSFDTKTNLPSPSVSSAVSLRLAVDGLKSAEALARTHLIDDMGDTTTERLITEARERALNSIRHTFFSTGEQVSGPMTFAEFVKLPEGTGVACKDGKLLFHSVFGWVHINSAGGWLNIPMHAKTAYEDFGPVEVRL